MNYIYKVSLAILFSSFYFSSLAQEQLILNGDTLNQRDEDGKKHGRWAEYLDENGETLLSSKVSNKSKFYYTTRYNHGNSLALGTMFMENEYGNFWKEIIENHLVREFPLQLDGIYYWYNKHGKIKTIAEFKKGEMLFLKVNNRKNADILMELVKTEYKSDTIILHRIQFDKKGEIKKNRYYIFDGYWTKIIQTKDTLIIDINPARADTCLP